MATATAQAPDESRLAALDAYGGCLGLAFQISDDLLDAVGCAADAGKRVQKDAGRGKLTYPSLLGVASSRLKLQEACRQAKGHLSLFGQAASPLVGLVDLVMERDR